jgi:membrane protein implicated in regulation of membrane protease activity
MLLLFGRYKDPARLGLGIVIVIIGIVIHQLILTLVGAVLAVWGLYAAVGWWRNRGRNAGRRGGTGEGGERGERGQGEEDREGGEGRRR